MKTTKLKVRKIGNSLGVILTKEAAEALHVEEGASLYMTPSKEGVLLKTSSDEKFEADMLLLDKVMIKYRNALRELAK